MITININTINAMKYVGPNHLVNIEIHIYNTYYIFN